MPTQGALGNLLSKLAEDLILLASDGGKLLYFGGDSVATVLSAALFEVLQIAGYVVNAVITVVSSDFSASAKTFQEAISNLVTTLITGLVKSQSLPWYQS